MIVPMADATHRSIGHLPPGQAAGYVTGSPSVKWTPADWAAHPGAVRIAQSPLLTVDEAPDADVLDVEDFAATLGDCAPWARNAAAAFRTAFRPGQRHPAIYASANAIPAVVAALHVGHVTSGVGLWVANWNLTEPQAIADVLAAAGPFPLVGIQWRSLQYYDLSVMAGSWLSTVSKVPSGAFRQVADGTLSLRQFEAERYQVADPNDPAVIRGVILAANLTMEHGTLADRKALIDYVISPGSTQAMPAGLVFWTLNP